MREFSSVNNNLALLGSTECYSGTAPIQNAMSSIPTTTAFTRTVIGTTDFGLASIRSSDGRIIFNKSGVYLISISANFSINANGVRRLLYSNKMYSCGVASSASEVVLNATMPFYIPSSGHTIPFSLFQNSGGTLNTDVDIYITKIS